jgi:hypothetical protein
MLSDKQKNEQAVFEKFVLRSGARPDWLSIESRPEPEPDLLCHHVTAGPIAFELVSLTDQKIAEIQAAGTKAIQSAFFTSDPTERIIVKKLGRKCRTSASKITLLIYTDGQIITPDDVIIPTIIPLLDTIEHQFNHVWFMGEHETCLVWSSR